MSVAFPLLLAAASSFDAIEWGAVAGASAVFITALVAGWKAVRSETDKLKKGEVSISSPAPILMDSTQINALIRALEENTYSHKSSMACNADVEKALIRLCDLILLKRSIS